MSYAGVTRDDGADPRLGARELLRDLRVLAAVRDAHAPWTPGEEAVVPIAVTEDGGVLTLTGEGTITAADLRVRALRERFVAAGMTLWLSDPEDEDEEGEDREYSPEEVSAPVEELDEEGLAELFAPTAVKVREFSRRGPMNARLLAPLVKTDVDYAEAEEWSVSAYATAESSPAWPPAKAESPVLTLNLVDLGGSWIDVRTPAQVAFPLPFWPNAERETVPVLDLDGFAGPAGETYRMLLTEGDGARDELDELAAHCALDVDAAHAALIPEALGGVEGADARIRSFLRAFGVPETLIEAAMADAVADLPGAERMAAGGWGKAIGDVLVGGTYEAVALTRRARPLARMSRKLRENPLLGVGLAAVEFTAGVIATARLRRGWKAIGILLITDAIGDLLVSLARLRRR